MQYDFKHDLNEWMNALRTKVQIKQVTGLFYNAIRFKMWFKWLIDCKLDLNANKINHRTKMQCSKIWNEIKWFKWMHEGLMCNKT